MPRFLLLHGFSGAGTSFDELSRLIRARQPEARIVAPDLAGHGSVSGTTTFAAEAERLGSLLRACGPGEAWHVVGYSMGGRLALGLAVAQLGVLASDAEPEHAGGAVAVAGQSTRVGQGLLQRLTLVGANPGLETAVERDQRRAADERWAQLIERDGVRSFLDAWRALPLFASQQRLDDAVLQKQQQIALSHDEEQLAAAMRSLSLSDMPNYRVALRTMPKHKSAYSLQVDWVAGGLDSKFERLAHEAHALTLGAESWTSRVVTVLGVGHNVVLEAPDQLVDIVCGCNPVSQGSPVQE